MRVSANFPRIGSLVELVRAGVEQGPCESLLGQRHRVSKNIPFQKGPLLG
jgi:hypothetical protein